MSVPKAKRKKEANPVVQKSRDLYVHLLRLVGDQKIMDRAYRPSLAKSITSQALAIAHCVTLADSIPLFGKDARARRRIIVQLNAVDGIQFLMSDIYSLYSVGTISQDRIVQTMQKIVELDRLIKKWMSDDRCTYDRVLKCHSLDDVGFDDKLNDASDVETIFPEDIEKKPDLSFSEIYEMTLKTTPEEQGIVNNPSGPDSPVVKEIRERQSHESDNATVEDIDSSTKLLDKKLIEQRSLR